MHDNDVKKEIIQFITERSSCVTPDFSNPDKIKKYFVDRKWSIDDFEQTEWTKHSYRNIYFLGKQKN